MILTEENYLAHYGILRKSGRYPWGSGETQSRRNKMFLDTIEELRKQGLTDAQIAKGFSTPEHPFTSTQLRAVKSIALNEQKQQQINQAQRLRDKGLSNVAIGERMGLNESSVRALLAPGAKDKLEILNATTDMLKRQVEEKKYIDVGAHVEKALSLGDNPGAPIGISKDKFSVALAKLQEEGYKIHYVKVRQLGTGHETTLKVLSKPDVPYREVFENRFNIKSISETTQDGGHSYVGIQPPLSISSKRVAIRYAEQGGASADGVIYVRPGKDDISLGKANYAQVRIAVDGTHYLKGMAVYKDDLPEGVDLMFNTNKSNTGRKHDAMKEMEKDKQGNIDPDNPFGAEIKAGGQQLHVDPSGHVHVKSVMNIVNEEGDWDTWSRNLPSQMLSKQSPDLAKSQLNVTYDRRRKEFDEISDLTNPSVRKKLLKTFSDETDSAAVHLKAAAMPRQATKVLLPIPSMKEHEIYAPTFRDGDRVALVRFPHGGTFEIPQLTVNNKNRDARRIIGPQAKDAVGIHHKVAERLSGADFDGDNVLVIPNARGQIKSTPALEGLKDFDPRKSYPPYDGMRTIDGGHYNAKTGQVDYPPKGKNPRGKGQKMGDVSNLITDMTIQGANSEELARAVRHSMVVIDSEKHVLDYKSSHQQNNIAQLKVKYQGKATAGASTLISRAGAEVHVPKYKPRPASQGGPIDKATGKKVFVPTGESFVSRKTGKTVLVTQKSERLAEEEDAHKLISSPGTQVERVYADHSNRLKALANEARLEMVHTKPTPISPSAKRVYSKEVESLNAKLNIALKNAPLERQAQILANKVVSQKRAANPDMDGDDIKKIQNQALAEMRVRTGAKKIPVDLTQEEWNAIQAGAISTHKLEQILDNADVDRIRELATPRVKLLMSSSKIARARAMVAQGYTQAEIADQLGVSLTTLKTSIS